MAISDISIAVKALKDAKEAIKKKKALTSGDYAGIGEIAELANELQLLAIIESAISTSTPFQTTTKLGITDSTARYITKRIDDHIEEKREQ